MKIRTRCLPTRTPHCRRHRPTREPGGSVACATDPRSAWGAGSWFNGTDPLLFKSCQANGNENSASCEMYLHGQCVNVTEQTMPSIYICAFCANTPNLRGGRIRDNGHVSG